MILETTTVKVVIGTGITFIPFLKIDTKGHFNKK